MLYELDAGDAYEAEKQCEACRDGRAVVTSADAGYTLAGACVLRAAVGDDAEALPPSLSLRYIAGVYYEADAYACAACPDALMSFTGSAGSLACECECVAFYLGLDVL